MTNTSKQHTGPYTIHVVWIDDSRESFEARVHIEDPSGLTIHLNDRRDREIFIPFTNVKIIDIDHG